MLKDDDGTTPTTPVRAREWICHQLAERAGLPVAEYIPILTHAGRVVFGSRMVLNGVPGSSIFRLHAALAEGSAILSAVYAVDLFLGNGDRHADNFVVERDATALRIRVIDFSEANACLERRTEVPGPGCNTVEVGRVLRKYYGFSAPAACKALDRLDALATLKQILNEMPADWLGLDARNEIAAWWLSAARPAHIATIRTGVTNGALL
jgi:hypothetical protein